MSFFLKSGWFCYRWFYFRSLYEIFPPRAPQNGTEALAAIQAELSVEAGDGRSASAQAGMQIVALVVTLAIALVSGALTGNEASWKGGYCLNSPSVNRPP